MKSACISLVSQSDLTTKKYKSYLFTASQIKTPLTQFVSYKDVLVR